MKTTFGIIGLIFTVLAAAGQVLLYDAVIQGASFSMGGTNGGGTGTCALSSEFQEVQNGDYLRVSDYVVSQKIYNPGTMNICKIRVGAKDAGTIHIDLRTEPNNLGTQIGASSQSVAISGTEYAFFDCVFTSPVTVTGDYYFTIEPEGTNSTQVGLNITADAYRAGYYGYYNSGANTPESLMFEVWTQ